MQARSSRSTPSRRSWFLAGLVLLLVLATVQFIERLARERDLEQERLGLITELAALGAHIEGVINAHLLLVHGLTAVISAHPDIGQAEFSRIAHGLVDERHALRNIAGAPDLVVSLLYPLPGNESVIGLDYLRHPIQGPAALKALDSGQSVLAGPLPLIQGGMGFLLRDPVFVTSATPDAPRRAWGLVTAVIEMDRLYRQTGLPEVLPRLRLALQAIDGTEAGGAVFFGDPATLAQEPVSIVIEIPGGVWRLSAVPRSGWHNAIHSHVPIQLLGLLVALAAAAMTYLLVHANEILEARVAARTAELATINKELETFTYSVSHDLKAPLRGIDGYSRLLLEDHRDRLDEEGQLFLNNVRQGVAQMGQLIEDLLDYSRMERRELHGVQIDLEPMVERLIRELQDDIQASGARLEVDLGGLSVHADPDGLLLVLRNLLDNALKFHRPGEPPVISLRAQATETTVRLDIQDQGIGFDMRFHDRIFEIFQRLQRAEDFPGTGVGLAMVRKAMQRMGGRIHAESRPGHGTTFHLELPR
ncbi:histidine kinase [Allochromatium vinosum]|uniref:histidine kinase n=1 Tax=Allochromatium vinosum (strain ATCC 17899 / DSM 180 / NBRC 103801 / NCIMB 10441 / D) TaxID=572477 RepID=D3RML6_ALLVD|nr:ATP-binding protein [Allochromatium vinosum]ADC61274.1 histidine kinase [Allochromatium vinosum DSM 180]MBK1655555.1 histidine kinase [Allochromatium vinosum]